MTRIMFRSEVELGKFLGSVDMIPEALQAISDKNSTYERHTTRSGINVFAFNCPSDDTTGFLEKEFELVPSKNIEVLDFISTKVNPSFSINGTAVKLFEDLGDVLKELQNNHINTPLIITGRGLGGYRAILSTLRLHHAIDLEESNGSKKTKRPICITFGCPLVGDASLQRAIAERPKWKSSFLNVVAKEDPVASILSSNTSYKPFGTFLFCTESGGHSAFEDQDSILPVLDAMKLSHKGNLKTYDYSTLLVSIRRNVLYRRVSELGEFKSNLLRSGIELQLREIGVLDDISNDQIDVIETKQIDKLKKKNAMNAYDPTKKLNEMKISLTYMEWYMKSTKHEGGYYDSYKNAKSATEIEKKQVMVKHQRSLNQYWKKFVEEKDIMPQKEGAKFRKRWLYGGANYMRIVEPLDIAEFYNKGNKNYIDNRPNHFKLIEKWANEGKKDSKSSGEKRNKAASLTEDSCFWSHVEEASSSLRELASEWSPELEEKLEQFEAYVRREIGNYAVSPDIFIKGSSFMKWWSEYQAYKGSAYSSELAQYMKNERYRLYE